VTWIRNKKKYIYDLYLEIAWKVRNAFMTILF